MNPLHEAELAAHEEVLNCTVLGGHLAVLLVEYDRLRARVAEMESGEVRIEWGNAFNDGHVWNAEVADEHAAEDVARLREPRFGCPAVRREVRTGPWTDAS